MFLVCHCHIINCRVTFNCSLSPKGSNTSGSWLASYLPKEARVSEDAESSTFKQLRIDNSFLLQDDHLCHNISEERGLNDTHRTLTRYLVVPASGHWSQFSPHVLLMQDQHRSPAYRWILTAINPTPANRGKAEHPIRDC